MTQLQFDTTKQTVLADPRIQSYISILNHKAIDTDKLVDDLIRKNNGVYEIIIDALIKTLDAALSNCYAREGTTFLGKAWRKVYGLFARKNV